MTNILFLDVDGVLNNRQSWRLKQHPDIIEVFGEPFIKESLEILRQIVVEFDFQIVLSSSWRLLWDNEDDICRTSLETVLDMYGLEIIDITPDFYSFSWEDAETRRRGCEIKRWIDKSEMNIDNILVLDDEVQDMAS